MSATAPTNQPTTTDAPSHEDAMCEEIEMRIEEQQTAKHRTRQRNIVDGIEYDTAKAAFICVTGNDLGERDHGYDHTSLYISPNLGQYFLAGRSGPSGQWRQRVEGSGWSAGHGLRVIDTPDARSLAEQHASREVFVKYFGEPQEG